MVKHVILWKLKDDIANKQEVLENIKQHLEALVGEVPGRTSCKVNICPLASSNADLMLDTTLTSEEALKGYQVHPAHVAAADTYVRPYTEIRMCMDYEEE